MRIISILGLIAFALPLSAQRLRLRDLGVSIGILAPGPLNAITDVEGVRVGQVTLIRGDNVRTGVTVILPHAGNLFQDKVAGAIFVGNGFGKITGTTQVEELGEIETPIVLTSTLNVPRVADALLDYMLALPGNENVRSINPLIAETNDGILNDARSRPVSRAEVFEAIRSAAGGAVAEGSVGAGTGTIAFGFKISSLAALVTATLLPLGTFYLFGNTLVSWAMLLIAALIFWRHRTNIRQLFAGKERMIGR